MSPNASLKVIDERLNIIASIIGHHVLNGKTNYDKEIRQQLAEAQKLYVKKEELEESLCQIVQ